MRYPYPGNIYTLAQIMEQDLPDAPSLGFRMAPNPSAPAEIESVLAVIQDSHLTVEQLLYVPGLADTEWRYIRTTNEQVPVFNYAGELEKLLACVDIEPEIGNFGQEECYGWWVTPKGYPRPQLWFDESGKLRTQVLGVIINEDEEGSTPD